MIHFASVSVTWPCPLTKVISHGADKIDEGREQRCAALNLLCSIHFLLLHKRAENNLKKHRCIEGKKDIKEDLNASIEQLCDSLDRFPKKP